MIELPPAQRGILRPLFHDVPYMTTLLNAVLDKGFGRAWTDDAKRPHVAHARLDFNFLAGDPDHPAARELLEQSDYEVVVPPRWKPLIERTWGSQLKIRQRVAFRGQRFDRARLRSIISTIPVGFELKRVGRSDVDDFAKLGTCLVGMFPTIDRYFEEGVGFGLTRDGQYVSACSSFAAAGKELEIEIQTHADYRRRGFATITAAAMILHCLENGITPHWDAQNSMSAELARKLGFCDELVYETFGR